jgi:16S rRNA (adenine1518-N6/adenine1519-N6)-dimethyltransferase
VTARPRKSLGQHFLHDQGVIARILATIAPEPADHFVEIGPGRGAITAPLLETVARLDAIEVDARLAASLAERFGDPKLHLHCADALRFDFGSLARRPRELRLAGNLPYNISTPLLFHLLKFGDLFRDLHVMLQKEVVQRMTAEPGSKVYGRLTVALAARCEVRALFVIGSGAFTPAPRIDSAFARLVPMPGRVGVIVDEGLFDRLLARAFSMRRKQLVNALGEWYTARELQDLGFDHHLRPEAITPGGFVRLANHLAARGT